MEEWNVVHHGKLASHRLLLEFIEKAALTVPDHYFSLTKFACGFSRQSNHIKTFPCHQNCCYLGFFRGLGIIFNSNNGLVSVGHHANEELVEFGGRFISSRSGEEGNFEPNGDKIKYNGSRPVSQIQSIFQRLHKRSMNFVNEYFDERVSSFVGVESLLRAKVRELSKMCQEQVQRVRVDLN